MESAFFVAETPRAGSTGHRFLLPPESTLTAAEVVALFQKATRKSEGKNFLAASRQVKQRLPNGSVRQGPETIVLTGVDTGGMSFIQKQRFQKMLQKRLTSLERLVTQEIDWDKEAAKTIIKRPELRAWLSEDRQSFLSATSLQFITPRWTDARLGTLLGVILGLITGGVLLFFLLSAPVDGNADQPGPDDDTMPQVKPTP